jgi:hypothetical protein
MDRAAELGGQLGEVREKQRVVLVCREAGVDIVAALIKFIGRPASSAVSPAARIRLRSVPFATSL